MKNALIVERALYLTREKALLFSDLHFGIEEALREKGFLVPNFNFDDNIKRLTTVFETLAKQNKKVQLVIVTGDLKHGFGRASQQEWREIIDFLRFLQKHSPKVIVIRGNHDNFLQSISKWQAIRVQREYYFKKTKSIAVHGDVVPLSENYANAKIVVLGHEHPAVGLREGGKVERYNCFLRGKFEDKTVIVLPAFNFFSGGHDLLQAQPLSPFLQADLEAFEVWGLADKPYYLGKLGKL